ncbi:MAG: 3'(2'),5'-bisphosphate nucleotidase CysQ [Sphingomonas sp.]|nr:MAG: 3'(2'),5'-bisphosphate nucleotidase CysQ [Sphingomonas sp.]
MADAVAKIAAEAGAMALDRFDTDFQRWEKTPGSPVCELDIAIDRMLKARLSTLLPEAGWLSEETADNADRLAHDLLWVVDPIDGTRDYIRARPGWCVSVALVDRGKPVIGILEAPSRDERWHAVIGQGATRNGVPLKAGNRADFPGSRTPVDALPKADRDLVMVHKPNSIALRIAMVAADEADLVATLRWGNEWDIAAAILVASEAGATVSDALGAPLIFNKPRPQAFGVLTSTPSIHASAVERLADRARAIGG